MKSSDISKISKIVFILLASFAVYKLLTKSKGSALSGISLGSTCPKPKPCFTLKTLKSDCPVRPAPTCPVCPTSNCPAPAPCPICPPCPSVSGAISQGLQGSTSSVSPSTTSADFGSLGRNLEF